MPNKCEHCDKNITKKSPALECCKCGNLVHANQVCSNLSSKHLDALKDGGLDWTCQECQRDSPKKKAFIIPDYADDSEDEEENVSDCKIDTKSLLKNISKEVESVIRTEMANFANTVDHCTKKVDDLSGKLDSYYCIIMELQKKNTHLQNQNTHLQLKVSALEQRVRIVEQKQIDDKIEVVGIPVVNDENVTSLANSIAIKLNLNPMQIKSAKRIQRSKDQEGIIQIKLEQKETVDEWVRASRMKNPKAKDIVQHNLPSDANENKIIVRRALTATNKTLLWNVRQKLQNNYKYIWFQNGKVLDRKGDKDKPITIRSEEDIVKLPAQPSLID